MIGALGGQEDGSANLASPIVPEIKIFHLQNDGFFAKLPPFRKLLMDTRRQRRDVKSDPTCRQWLDLAGIPRWYPVLATERAGVGFEAS
jgi:hypothetical protein